MENQPLTTIRSWFRRASSLAGTEATQEKTIAQVPEPVPAAPQTPQSPAHPQPQPPPLPKQETPLTNIPESQLATPPPPSSSTPPATPKASQLHTPQLSPNPEPEPKPMITPIPEPEPEPTPEPQTKNIFMQRESSKAAADMDAESRAQNMPRTNDETSPTSTRKDDSPLKAITIAGENTGAYMELGTSGHQKHRKEKQLQHCQGKENEGDGEDGRFANKLGGKEEEGRAVALVVNNNVQSVNNSILFSSSCGQRSPGVHIGLARQRRPNAAKGK